MTSRAPKENPLRRLLRSARGAGRPGAISQRALADALGVDERAIKRWEQRGEAPANLPDLHHQEALAEALPLLDPDELARVVDGIKQQAIASRASLERRLRAAEKAIGRAEAKEAEQARALAELTKRIDALVRSLSDAGVIPG